MLGIILMIFFEIQFLNGWIIWPSLQWVTQQWHNSEIASFTLENWSWSSRRGWSHWIDLCCKRFWKTLSINVVVRCYMHLHLILTHNRWESLPQFFGIPSTVLDLGFPVCILFGCIQFMKFAYLEYPCRAINSCFWLPVSPFQSTRPPSGGSTFTVEPRRHRLISPMHCSFRSMLV